VAELVIIIYSSEIKDGTVITLQEPPDGILAHMLTYMFHEENERLMRCQATKTVWWYV